MNPTSHPPGSIEKIEVLRQRAEQQVELFHPQDKIDYRGVKYFPMTHLARGAYRCKVGLGRLRKRQE